MNQNKQLLLSKLPKLNQEVLRRCFNNLLNAGVEIDPVDFQIAIGSFLHLMSSNDSKVALITMLNLKPKACGWDRRFFKRLANGGAGDEIDSRKLSEVRGWIYTDNNGITTGLSDEWLVVKEEIAMTSCSSCGGRFPTHYCASGGSVCNHCRAHSDDPNVKRTANFNTCQNCTAVACVYHPQRKPKLEDKTNEKPDMGIPF